MKIFEPFQCVLMKAVPVAVSGRPQLQTCGGRGFLPICRMAHKGESPGSPVRDVTALRQ